MNEDLFFSIEGDRCGKLKRIDIKRGKRQQWMGRGREREDNKQRRRKRKGTWEKETEEIQGREEKEKKGREIGREGRRIETKRKKGKS